MNRQILRVSVLLCVVSAPHVAAQITEDHVISGKPLRAWIRDLKYGNAPEAKKAAETVASLGADAGLVIPAVMKAMGKGKGVCSACVEALGRFGSSKYDVSVRAKLYAIRRHEDLALRGRVYWALDRIGVDVVPILKKELDDKKMRTWAIGALGDLGPRAAKARTSLTKILATVVKPLPPGLHNALVRARHKRRTDFAVTNRRAAALALGKIADCSYATFKTLSDRLGDPDVQVRRHSVIALAQQGPGCVDWLLKALKRDDDEIVSSAVQVLASYGPAAKKAIPGLRKLSVTKRKLAKSRQLAGEAVLRIEKSLSMLEQATSQNESLRMQAVSEIVHYGPSAVPVLKKVFAGTDTKLKIAALDALFQTPIGKKNARKSQGRGSRSSMPDLPRPRMDVSKLMPRLRTLAKDEDPRVAAAALRAVGRLGRGQGVVGVMLTALASRSIDARAAAIQGLLRVELDQAEGRAAIPHLIDALANAKTCVDAGRILGKIGHSAVAPLLDTLGGENTYARFYAVWALGEVGPPAAEAIKPLEALLAKSSGPNLKKEIKSALAKIRK